MTRARTLLLLQRVDVADEHLVPLDTPPRAELALRRVLGRGGGLGLGLGLGLRLRLRLGLGLGFGLGLVITRTWGEAEGAARSAARSEAGGSGCACGASNHLVSALSSLTCRTWLGLANMAGVITSDHLVSALGSLTWWWGG